MSLFIIFWANIGYPLSILAIGKVIKRDNKKNYSNKPSVTVMVVAHNEEKVIENKLINLKELNYPKENIKFLIASDNSTDNTNRIVEEYQKKNPDFPLELYISKEHKGKTNAQNEAQKRVQTEYLVMTDANSMIDKDAIIELMSSFTSDNIAYVTGKLQYINEKSSATSSNESFYWKLDLTVREIESRIQTITAGNGALYAIKNDKYYDFSPINSHDSMMPLFFALKKERAIANHQALVYEKAGETISDEYGRKVRMNRALLSHIIPDIRILNVFKFRWFSYFYLGHRTARNLLWLAHALLLISNVFLTLNARFYFYAFIIHIAILILGLFKPFYSSNNRYINLIHYYVITIIAQWNGIINILSGKAKPVWEKAESTRQ
ncbi:glycosyltransferase [Aerococcus viridans]|uniref:glycosyltransferase n=1 Tax=Aerococcus viridans TaxID=1377 RepID=UPI002DBD5E28|nr:glycosyltransferase [Aerococcus viridans]MEB7389002.1 glycosyltransferase [Aerococcus viridans]